MDDQDTEFTSSNHPSRRKDSGPSDVEWALLTREVQTMKKALEDLAEELRKYMIASVSKCDNCSVGKQVRDQLKDHEDRLRGIERMVWKAAGAAAIGATIFTYLLDKIFK